MSEHNVDNFLFGGGKSASFPHIGSKITGTVSAPPELQQQRDMESGKPLTWDDGNPRMQMVITLDTDERDPEDPDDDGTRRLFVKSGMKAALARAVKAAGASRIEVGGRLTVTYTADDNARKKKGFNAPKIYEATYVRPADQALGVETAAPAAQAQAAAPAAGAGDNSAAVGNLSPEALEALKGLGLLGK
jgi:hypothetical protein